MRFIKLSRLRLLLRPPWRRLPYRPVDRLYAIEFHPGEDHQREGDPMITTRKTITTTSTVVRREILVETNTSTTTGSTGVTGIANSETGIVIATFGKEIRHRAAETIESEMPLEIDIRVEATEEIHQGREIRWRMMT